MNEKDTWMREFRLEEGYVDSDGRRHLEGTLRAATARDEIRALNDFRVFLAPRRFLDVALARTLVCFGTLDRIDAGVVERLAPQDRGILERLYRELNGYDEAA